MMEIARRVRTIVRHGVRGLTGAEVLVGGFAAGGSGSYCHAIVRIVDGKVVGVNYTGDNDEMIGKEGVCAPIVRGCLREHEKAPEARTANRAS